MRTFRLTFPATPSLAGATAGARVSSHDLEPERVPHQPNDCEINLSKNIPPHRRYHLSLYCASLRSRVVARADGNEPSSREISRRVARAVVVPTFQRAWGTLSVVCGGRWSGTTIGDTSGQGEAGGGAAEGGRGEGDREREREGRDDGLSRRPTSGDSFVHRSSLIDPPPPLPPPRNRRLSASPTSAKNRGNAPTRESSRSQRIRWCLNTRRTTLHTHTHTNTLFAPSQSVFPRFFATHLVTHH